MRTMHIPGHNTNICNKNMNICVTSGIICDNNIYEFSFIITDFRVKMTIKKRDNYTNMRNDNTRIDNNNPPEYSQR